MSIHKAQRDQALFHLKEACRLMGWAVGLPKKDTRYMVIGVEAIVAQISYDNDDSMDVLAYEEPEGETQ